MKRQQKTQSEETEQTSAMTQLLELSDRIFKITMINMLKVCQLYLQTFFFYVKSFNGKKQAACKNRWEQGDKDSEKESKGNVRNQKHSN